MTEFKHSGTKVRSPILEELATPLEKIRVSMNGWDMGKPPEAMRKAAHLYEEKNDDWNDSWRAAGQTIFDMADGEAVTIESPEQATSFALYWMRLVKMYRQFNGEFRSPDGLNFEAASDSADDGIAYSGMHRAVLEEQGDESE